MPNARALPMRCFLAFTMVALFGCFPARAALDTATQRALLAEATEAFEAGNRLMATDGAAAQAQYEQATLRLERIVREGGIENGKLYYNLGNIWYQRGNVGRAILNYLRAERFMPNDTNLQQNLAFVRQQRKDAFETPETRKVLNTLFFWHYDFPSRMRLQAFAFFFVAFWILAGVRLFWKHGLLNGALAGCGLLALLLFISLTVEANYHRNHPRGVVVAPETIARKGDGITYQPSFAEPLHAGTEFTVQEDRGEWLRVALPDERTSWLRREDVALVHELPGQGAGAR